MVFSVLPAIVLLHGFRGNHLGVDAIAENLKALGFKVFTPDLPPFGEADQTNTLLEYTPDSYARDVADYITHHHLRSPVLVGHSMGSLVAAATAERYPKIVSHKIVFLAPISEKPSQFFANLTPLSTSLPDKLVGFLTTMFLTAHYNPKELSRTLGLTYASSKTGSPKDDIRGAARFSCQYSLDDFNLKRYDVLMVAGTKDRLIPRAQTEELAKRKGYQTVFLQDAGHLLNYECPERIARVIEGFIY